MNIERAYKVVKREQEFLGFTTADETLKWIESAGKLAVPQDAWDAYVAFASEPR